MTNHDHVHDWVWGDYVANHTGRNKHGSYTSAYGYQWYECNDCGERRFTILLDGEPLDHDDEQ